jgi:hypothetical protein
MESRLFSLHNVVESENVSRYRAIDTISDYLKKLNIFDATYNLPEQGLQADGVFLAQGEGVFSDVSQYMLKIDDNKAQEIIREAFRQAYLEIHKSDLGNITKKVLLAYHDKGKEEGGLDQTDIPNFLYRSLKSFERGFLAKKHTLNSDAF